MTPGIYIMAPKCAIRGPVRERLSRRVRVLGAEKLFNQTYVRIVELTTREPIWCEGEEKLRSTKTWEFLSIERSE